eukprot:TRINITY_DN73914_c0_g1_i1.p1 TRINITY_DN73914_c0_g1~~TRINITY_DN73914_c0_g1_i1.p1  ORF type:complete len:721 (-),score=190.91 TRINITY_DN73914_c0_g1_i1:55-2178(-)
MAIYSANADDYSKPAKQREAAVLLSVAERRAANGEAAGAYQASIDATAIFTSVGDLSSAADARRLALRQLALDGRAEEARSTAETALEACKKLGDQAAEAKTLLCMSELCAMKSSPDQHAEALRLANQARALCQASQQPDLESRALLDLSSLYCSPFSLADAGPQKALQAARAMEELSEALKDDLGVALAKQAAARALLASGDGKGEWKKKADGALAIFRSMGDQRLVATQLLATAKLHLEAQDPRSAAGLASEALSIFGQQQGVDGISALQILADAHVKLGEASKAVETIQEHVEQCRLAGDERRLAAMQEVLMKALAAIKGREEDASDAARAAAQSYSKIGKVQRQCEVLRLISLLHRDKREYDRAIIMAQEALAAAKQAQRPEEIEAAMQAIADACVAAGKHERAWKAAEQLRSEGLGSAADSSAWLCTATALLEADAPGASEAARQAQAVAEAAGLRSLQAKALLLSARAALAQNKTKAALVASQRASRLFRQDSQAQGDAEALVVAGKAEMLQLESGVREPTLTAWKLAAQKLQETATRAGFVDAILGAEAYGMLAKAQTALGQSDAASGSLQFAAMLYRQGGNKPDPSIMALEHAQGAATALGGSQEAEAASAALALMPENPDEVEAERVARERTDAYKNMGGGMVRTRHGALADPKTGLEFQVAFRRDQLGSAANVLQRYCRQALAGSRAPLIEAPAPLA